MSDPIPPETNAAELPVAGSATPQTDDTLILPQAEPHPEKIGRYAVVNFLGGGGFGKVYVAKDESLNRLVAIKVPHGLPQDQAETEASLEEARKLAQLDHSHIIPVFDVGQLPDGRPFFVSKYIVGEDLSRRMAQGPLPVRQAVEIVAQIAEALHQAHQQGIVHRDVKPSNILLDFTGQAYLADFGLAWHTHTSDPITSALVGTPAYMSPEQIACQPLDGRTDQWSLGVVLYQALTGQHPFMADNPQQLVQNIYQSPLPPPSLPDDAPENLRSVIHQSLEKQPSSRFADCTSLAHALRDCITKTKPSDATSTKKNVNVNAQVRLPGCLLTLTIAMSLLLVIYMAGGFAPLGPTHQRIAFSNRKDAQKFSKFGTKNSPLPWNTPPRTHQELADKLARAGNYDEAVKEYNLAVAEEPHNAKLYFARGICYLKQDLYAQAVVDFNQVKSTSYDWEILKVPDVARTYQLYGDQLLKDGVYDAAKTAYSESIALQGDKAPAAAFFGRGKCLLREKKWDEAIRDFAKAEQFDPRYPSPYLNAKEYGQAFAQRAEHTLEDGKLEDAYRDASIAVGIDSQNALAYLVKGTVRLMQGEKDDALKEFALSIKHNDQDPRPYSLRGYIHLRENDFEGAIVDLSYAIKLASDPKDLKNRGLAYFNSEEYDRAITDFDATLAKLPDDAQLYFYRAECFREQGFSEKALADYEMAIKKDPAYSAPQVSRGFIFNLQKNYKEALDAYTKALKLGYSDPKYVLELRANTFKNDDQSDFAERDLELAVQFGFLVNNPTNSQKRCEVAFQLATSNDPPYQLGLIALRLAQEACDLSRNSDADCLDALAAAQASLGNYDEALKTISKAISKANASQRTKFQDRQRYYEQKKPFVSP